MKALMVWAALAALAGCDSKSGDDGKGDLVGEGDAYPAVHVQDCDGNEVDLRAWFAQHDATFVSFGAQWCQVCQEEAPTINSELVDGLADKGDAVSVVQVLIENQPDEAPPLSLCTAWRDRLQARYVVLVDVRQEELAPFFGTAISVLPLQLIVTRDGIIRFSKLGPIPTDIKSIVEGWLP